MNTLIAKTAIITVAVAIALSVIGASLAALFAPASVAKSAVSMGMYRTGANFQEIAYNRRPSAEHLGKLIDYAVAGKSNALLVKYCPVMMESSDYEAYASYRDKTGGSGLIVGAYHQYVCGNYAAALYRAKKKAEAVEVLRLAVSGSYPENNAVQYLLYEVVEKEDVETALAIRDYLLPLYLYLLQECPTAPSSEMTDIAKDQSVIYSLLLEKDPENVYYQDQLRFWLARV